MELLEWLDRKDIKHKRLSERKYYSSVFVGIVCFLTLFFAFMYTALSETVYFWDDATYWEISSYLAKKPLSFSMVKDFYVSLTTQDYNWMPGVLPSLWMRVFGVTRLSYVTAITIIYLIPVEVVCYLISKKMSKAPEITFLLSMLLLPAVMYLTAIGFADIGGVLIGLLCYYLYYAEDFKRHGWLKGVILGIMLVKIMLFRRYFAFFAVSFVTSMCVDSILLRKPKKDLIISLVTIGVLLFVFLFPFVENILLRDYSSLYSSYKYNALTDFKLITRYFGVLTLLVSILMTVVAVKNKRDYRAIMAMMQILICSVMFISTQTHGQQHLLLYIPALYVIFITGINAINKKGIFAAVSIIAMLNTISPLIPRHQPNNIQDIRGLAFIPTYSVKPEKRYDINQLIALKNDLDNAIPEGETCGILSSSFTLNSSVLINLEPSLNRQSQRDASYIVGLPEVDSRDFWRLNEIYNSNYILVATPPQTHLAKGEQKIVEEAVNSLINRQDIGIFFEEIPSFRERIGTIEVRLYHRTGDVTETAKVEFKNKLDLGDGK